MCDPHIYVPRMPRVSFTQSIQRHVACPTTEAEGRTVGDVLASVFAHNPKAKGYVLDDQGAVRPHMIVFVNGKQIVDPVGLSDAVGQDAEVFVMQALSGG